jgi:hypothetical protein
MGIRGSVIGNTGDFDSPDPRSSRGPGASEESEALASGKLVPLVAPLRLAPRFNSTVLPVPCRLCGGPTWLSDDSGAIHPCCELWSRSGGRVDDYGLLVCVACETGAGLNREQRRRHG